MGLDCSHDAFHGAYSAFNRFRKAVAKASGGSFPPHDDGAVDDDGKPMDPSRWYWDGTEETHPGLYAFLSHSDCDGELTPDECLLVANELEQLLPAIESMGEGSGHIQMTGGYGEVARRFIAGCREAHRNGEPLIFE